MNDEFRTIQESTRDPGRLGQAITIAIALAAPVVALGIFLFVFRELDARIGVRLTALPEVHSLFGSVDVSAQKTAFLAALAFLAATWAGIFFISGKRSLWEPPQRGALVAARATLTKRFILLVDIALAALVILWAAYFVRSAQFANVYDTNDVLWLMGGDPHAYTIFSRSCEVILATINSNNDREAYGMGGALLYCGLRALGFPPDYASMLLIVRLANFFMAATFLWALWRYWGSHASGSIWARVIAAVAFLVVVRRLLEQDGVLVVFANLGGLRYAPVLLLLLAACGTNWSDRPVIRAIRLALAGFCIALFPDTGLLATIGLVVMESAQGRDRMDVLRRAALAAVGALFFAIAANVFLAWLIPSAAFSIGWAVVAADSGFGGNIITWDSTFIVILTIPIVVATLCVAKAGQVVQQTTAVTALSRQDAVALAISMMMIAWTMYFLHRPPPPPYVHIIFTLLVMFPISWAMQYVQGIHDIRKYLMAPILVLICLFFVQQTRILPSADEILSPKKATTKGLVDWSGLRLPEAFVGKMTARLEELRRIRTPDALVVTGIPFAVASSSGQMRAPAEALFTLGRENDVAAFLKRVQTERPSMIIFDGDGSPAWGAETILKISQRIEAGLQPDYVRSEGVRHWRAWVAVVPSAAR